MPIYEYYCPRCDGRFNHLARQFDAPPPPCPGCGSREVVKMVSRVNAVRSETERHQEMEKRAQGVDAEDPQAIARFLQDIGDEADDVAPIDKEAFREIVARRANGATDEELQDVVDELPRVSQRFEGKVPTPYEEHDYSAHHHHHSCHDCGHDHAHDHEDQRPSKKTQRGARDLGWA